MTITLRSGLCLPKHLGQVRGESARRYYERLGFKWLGDLPGERLNMLPEDDSWKKNGNGVYKGEKLVFEIHDNREEFPGNAYVIPRDI
jgi:hypothetical protein